MLELSLVRNTSRDYQLQTYNPDGTVSSGVFQGSDTIASRVWLGEGYPVVVTPTTIWVNALQGIFQVTFNDSDTASLNVGEYRIQTTVERPTQPGRTAVIFDGLLSIIDAPSTTAATSLVTPGYLQTCLQVMNLNEDQIAMLSQLNFAASRLIRKHCNRWFNRRPSADGSLTAYDGLYTMDWPSKIVILRQFPVNGILRVRTNPTQVFNVTNTSSSNQQATATLTWTGVQDIPDVPPVTTGIRLWSLSSGTPTTVNLLFSTYKTFQSLATAINAVGNGWSALVVDSKYNLWPTSDLRQGIGPSCAIGTFAQQGFWVHTDDVPVQIDQEAGIMWVDEGMNDPWSSPRFGTYLDTGLGDLSIGGGLNGIRVMYDAGWDTVPEDIQEACVETVQDMINLLNIDQRMQSETDGSYSYELSRIDRYALPPSVLGKIGYYRNVRS